VSRLASANQQLMGTNQTLNSTVSQMDSTISRMRAQMQTLDQQVAELSNPPVRPSAKRSAPRRATPRVDPRWQQVQAQIAEQQKQLKATQDLVAKNQTDIENQLGSTRDELNGSIAKTHEELVALEKRGDRNYYEFDLSKSKNFQRVGPVLLSLRRADQKHQHFNLEILVDDKQLSKNSVNLYEPVWIDRTDDPSPTQVVVNQIDKNYVHGYVSAPKYTKAELEAAQTQDPAAQTPGPSPANGQPATQQNPPAKQPNWPQ
jgi:uncharacterized coiled-coil protein SlyX